MSDTITKCPACHTAFKVTTELLTAANGTVRCGSCLKAFKATDYLLTPLPDEIITSDDKNHQEPEIEIPHNEENISPESEEQQKQEKSSPEADYIQELLVESASEEDLSEEIKDQHFETNESSGEDVEDIDNFDHPSQLSTSLIEERQTHKNFPWKWLSASLLLGFITIVQIAWIRFEDLSTRQPYNALYVYACQLVPCKLKTPIDTQQIETSQLFVRSHPKEQNALTVDAIIINKAQFDQPFPALALEFRNIHGKAVASRHFQPQEYLRGDLRGATIMPSEQPVQLSLQIVDPGESAVNYLLSIVDAQKMTKK